MVELLESLWGAIKSEEIVVGLLLALALYFAAKISGLTAKFLSVWREWQFATYAGSVGLEKEDVLESVRGYVRQYGMDTDPCARVDLADALQVRRTDLFRVVDAFMRSSSKSKHLFLFADCGMGKTSFLINYFHRRRLLFRLTGTDMLLVTLSNASSFGLVGNVEFSKRASTILLIDALDEDPLVLDGIEKRIETLLKEVSGFKRVVITCRSQFFDSDDHIPSDTGILRAGPTKAGVSKEYEFKRVYIAPFDASQVRTYLRRNIPGVRSTIRRWRAKSLVKRVRNLALRPMLLAHIPEILDQGGIEDSMLLVDIYRALASAWVEREKHWVTQKELFYFSRRLASDLYEKRHMRRGEFCTRDEIVSLAESWGVNIRIEHLTGRSLLNRMSDGKCKFAHRSILEFFVVDDVLSSPPGRNVDLTLQMGRFLLERLRVEQDAHDICGGRGIFVQTISAEERVGYPTNFSLEIGMDVEVRAGLIYNLPIEFPGAKDQGQLLGEHLQVMLSSVRVGQLVDVRLSLEPPSDDFPQARLYLGVWCEEQVVLSVVTVSYECWCDATSPRWSDRRVYNLVGAMAGAGFRSFELKWRAITRYNAPGEPMEVDAAHGCSALLVNRGDRGETEFRVIPSLRDGDGPLSCFGILSGGSLHLLAGRKFRVLGPRSHVVDNIGKSIQQDEPLLPAAERWPDRKRRN